MNNCTFGWAVFDYGGVIAEEGFVAGLHAIAEQEGLDSRHLFEKTRELIHSSGYLLGEILEENFWRAFRRETGISRTDQDLRNEILSRFILRPEMLELVSTLRSKGVRTAILSDQVNWLDELDIRDDFFRYFDRVYNSFHVGLSKNNPAVFEELIQWIDCSPADIIFIDDHLPHVNRARSRGLNGIHYTDQPGFIKELSAYCPGLFP
ncbi:MAG: HAD family hydrolase [Desulfonatronovibrio sp.]